MRDFAKFILSAFARSFGSTCASAVLLVFGVSPDKITSLIIDGPPWPLETWWFPYVLVVSSILIIAYVFYKQSRFEIEKPQPFNVSIPALIYYIRSRSCWGINENYKNTLQDLDIFTEINQKVRDGIVEVHGKRENPQWAQSLDGGWSKTSEPIIRSLPDYWDHMEISAAALIYSSEMVPETECFPSASQNQYPRFTDLRVSWPQVLCAWPKANVIKQTWKVIRLWLSDSSSVLKRLGIKKG